MPDSLFPGKKIYFCPARLGSFKKDVMTAVQKTGSTAEDGIQEHYVQFRDIHKIYGRKEVLAGVSVNIRKGELLSLLGPSGCGKTTLLRILAGFVNPSSGQVRVGGVVQNNIPPNKRNVGMVFQHYCLFPHMTVFDNVTFGLKMRGTDQATMEKRAMEYLDLVHLADQRNRYPGQLSGGMKQRVALARVLAFQPSVLLLDEPFAALDRNLKDEMQFEVRKLQQMLKITTLFVTHDQKEAMTISDRIAVMNYGHIEHEGAPLDIYDHPKTRFAAEFLGVPHFLDARITSCTQGRARVELALGGELSVPVVRPVEPGSAWLAVRAERIQIAALNASGQLNPADVQNCVGMPGKIVFATNAGHTITYEVELPDAKRLIVEEPRQDKADGFSPGDDVELLIHAENCSLLTN